MLIERVAVNPLQGRTPLDVAREHFNIDAMTVLLARQGSKK